MLLLNIIVLFIVLDFYKSLDVSNSKPAVIVLQQDVHMFTISSTNKLEQM